MIKNEEKKIDLLKDLLLNDDRLEVDALKQKIKAIEAIIEEKEQLSEKINPIITERLSEYTTEIPDKLGPTITKSLKNEIKNSQDAVVDAIYPILGKMIKKYIQKEFEILSEKINSQIKRRFTIKNWFRKAKSKVTGVSEKDLILKDITSTEIQEVFIIEKDSGLLKANYSKTKTIDKDVLSGMLTAIKSFVEDAFKTGSGDLQFIEHGLYKIHLQNFKSYYIAVVIQGVFDYTYQNRLENKLFDFSKSYLSKNNSKTAITKALEITFEK